MRSLLTILLVSVFMNGFAQKIPLADPFVLKHNGAWYLYGTSGADPDAGIPVYQSTDLLTWNGPVGLAATGLALRKGDSFGDTGFWAPYVLFANNKFYMYYTANEKIAVAISDSPLGPFRQEEKKPIHDDLKEIDPHVFIDDDGKKYLYFVRLIDGNRTYGAELNDDLMSIKENTVVSCITQSQDWEIISGSKWPVTEAPSMLKQNGVYYLFYTGNDFRSPAYNVGYATSTSPLGPWTKNKNNPIIPETRGVPGTGGCEFITSDSNELLMFYHSHYDNKRVRPRTIVYSKCLFTKDGTIKVEEQKIFPGIKIYSTNK